MDGFYSFNDKFEPAGNDTFIRAIRTYFIRENGDISVSAFKCRNGGVSVTRSNNELMAKAISFMKYNFEGAMACFPVLLCCGSGITSVHKPSWINENHWELFGDGNLSRLSERQIEDIINGISLVPDIYG